MHSHAEVDAAAAWACPRQPVMARIRRHLVHPAGMCCKEYGCLGPLKIGPMSACLWGANGSTAAIMHANQNKTEYILHWWPAFQHSDADPLAVGPTNLNLWQHLLLLLLMLQRVPLLLDHHLLLLLLQHGLPGSPR